MFGSVLLEEVTGIMLEPLRGEENTVGSLFFNWMS